MHIWLQIRVTIFGLLNKFSQKSPNIWVTFWFILNIITCYVKTDAANFGQLLEDIGLLFIPTSGHTSPDVQYD